MKICWPPTIRHVIERLRISADVARSGSKNCPPFRSFKDNRMRFCMKYSRLRNTYWCHLCQAGLTNNCRISGVLRVFPPLNNTYARDCVFVSIDEFLGCASMYALRIVSVRACSTKNNNYAVVDMLYQKQQLWSR